MEELLKGVKIGKLLVKEEKKDIKKIVTIVLAVLGVLAAIGGIAYGIYRFVNRDMYDDFEADFEDIYDEECFED